ncbi:MAG: signal peptidase II [Verrucomicrobia bacterium]|nr:signal peptidase II [Verrucomicrobiota bacterium]
MPEVPQEKAAPRLNRILLLGLVALCAATIDQVSKVLIFQAVSDDPTVRHELLGGVVVFSKAWNPGAAFGIFGSLPYSAVLLAITTVVTIVVLAWLFRHFVETHLVTGAIALGLIYGGALGNLVDRIAFGKVRDFIELHLWLFTWPAFNVADVCIVAGIVLLLIGLATLPVHKHPAHRVFSSSGSASSADRADTPTSSTEEA